MKKIIILTAVILTAIVSLLIINSKASAEPTIKRTKSIISVEVMSGDTLWDIAEEYYTPEFKSIKNYVDEISKTNRLSSDCIHAGTYLIIPVYKDNSINN